MFLSGASAQLICKRIPKINKENITTKNSKIHVNNVQTISFILSKNKNVFFLISLKHEINLIETKTFDHRALKEKKMDNILDSLNILLIKELSWICRLYLGPLHQDFVVSKHKFGCIYGVSSHENELFILTKDDITVLETVHPLELKRHICPVRPGSRRRYSPWAFTISNSLGYTFYRAGIEILNIFTGKCVETIPLNFEFVNGSGCIEAYKNTLLIIPSGAHTILVLDLEKKQLIRQISSQGTERGKLYNPCALASKGDYIYVADKGNHRIQKFDWKTGSGIQIFGDSSVLFLPCAIAVQNDELYVSDQKHHKLTVFHTSYNLILGKIEVDSVYGRLLYFWGTQLLVSDYYEERFLIFK